MSEDVVALMVRQLADQVPVQPAPVSTVLSSIRSRG